MGTAAPGETAETREPLTIDELARRAGLPVRTIREYHTMRLLPPPQRRGRPGPARDRPAQGAAAPHRPPAPGYSVARQRRPPPALVGGDAPGSLPRGAPRPTR